MAGVALNYDMSQLDVAASTLNGISGLIEPAVITNTVAGIVESQTRRRIQDEKEAPDGTPWADWSPGYAETRHSGHSLLQGEGELLDTIFGEQRGDDAVVGSPMIYAATQQDGSEDGDTPARPLLGVSDDNASEIEGVVIAYLQGLQL